MLLIHPFLFQIELFMNQKRDSNIIVKLNYRHLLLGSNLNELRQKLQRPCLFVFYQKKKILDIWTVD
jgi:hypothetical protein